MNQSLYGATLTRDDGSTQAFNLHKLITTVGRNEANDILLDDPTVSSFHCNILCREDGYHLLDMKSRNGCWVNKDRVAECRLEDGDRLEIGDVVLHFAKKQSISDKGQPLFSRLAQKVQTMVVTSPGLRSQAEDLIKEVERERHTFSTLMEILTSLTEASSLKEFSSRLQEHLNRIVECRTIDIYCQNKGLLKTAKNLMNMHLCRLN